jgi:hypothetical protein
VPPARPESLATARAHLGSGIFRFLFSCAVVAAYFTIP